MAILKIARMGHPVLNMRAEEIPDPRAPDVLALAGHMIDTLIDIDGMGLAAPQVHVPKRLVIFRSPQSADEEGDGEREWSGLTVLVNPFVEAIGDDVIEGWEGCLSVPGLCGLVTRPAHIRYGGVTPKGETIEREVDGYHAKVVQHEFDHLDGILYTERMTDMTKLIFETESRYQHQSPEDGDDEDEAVQEDIA